MSVIGPVVDLDLIETCLTKQQVKDAPSADLARPVSRVREEQLLRYYRIPIYWAVVACGQPQ